MKKLPSLIALVDADEVLLHHAARAEIEVSDLAVADLAARQADRLARRLEQRARCARPERVPRRHGRHRDRIALALGAIAPAVEDEEDDGSRS